MLRAPINPKKLTNTWVLCGQVARISRNQKSVNFQTKQITSCLTILCPVVNCAVLLMMIPGSHSWSGEQ